MTITATPHSRDLTPWERDRLAWYGAIIGDDPKAVAEMQATEQAWTDLPAPPPCPAWCARAAGHGWDDSDPRADSEDSCRFHSADFGPSELAFHVSQLETAHRDGTTRLHTPDVLTPFDVGQRIAEPLGVIDVAHAALDAAALLRQILAGTATSRSVTR